MNLSEKIVELVNLKKEGKTWDFKAKWYTSKALLLHDILNMANNETDKDSFIIIGVDENDDFSLIDVKNDLNRYNQNDLNNLLHSPKTKFAGDNIPIVKLETIDINDCSIDIIIIKSTDNVPYYLTEDYIEALSPTNGKKSEKIVYSSNIYVRRNDSNTPIDKCANDIEIVRLWKKRFGIDLSVHEKFLRILSNKEEWESYNNVYFHRYYPDFTLKISDENCNDEYHRASYSYDQYDKMQHTYILEIFFRNMKIDEYRIDLLDGGRMPFVYPNTEYIAKQTLYDRQEYSYLYFIKNDVRDKLNNVLIDLERNDEHRYIYGIIKEYVIFFDSNEEKTRYDEYLKNNIDGILGQSKELINDYSGIEVDSGIVKEKIIEELCFQKTIVKTFDDSKLKRINFIV